MGKIVVMGRRTFEDLPGKMALDGRVNIVLSRTPGYRAKGAQVVGSIEEALALLEDYQQKGYGSSDIYIIGGEQIYRAFLPYCDTAHITKIDYAYSADAYMENLDADPAWEMTAESEEQTYFDVEFYFRKYERVHP